MGVFLREKFIVTLNCFCDQPCGTLVDSMQGNPDVRATGMVLGSMRENPDVIPLQIALHGDLDPFTT